MTSTLGSPSARPPLTLYESSEVTPRILLTLDIQNLRVFVNRGAPVLAELASKLHRLLQRGEFP
jgi:hypothetical protein